MVDPRIGDCLIEKTNPSMGLAEPITRYLEQGAPERPVLLET